MRRFWLTLGGLLLIAGGMFAQQPPAQQPNASAMLDAVLGKWEQTMTGLESLYVECSRKKIDRQLNTTEFKKGTALLLKQKGENCRACLHLDKYVEGKTPGVYDVKTDDFERFICSGTFLYEFVPSDKVIRIHKMQGPIADNFLSFLIGMKAADAKKRYQIRWVPPRPGDTFYHYLQILPRENNQADFTEAHLTLDARTFLPRELRYWEPNGNEITWDCSKVNSNANIRPAEFEKPPLPTKNWKWADVPANEGPRVIRPAP